LEFGSPDERSLHRLLSDCVRRASDTDAPLVRQPTLTRGRRNLDRRAVNALVARLAAGFDPAALTPAPPDAKEKQGR
ncbi:MAG TPA: hypothetical protein VGE52_01270, partial [Pirellulales bacterium]